MIPSLQIVLGGLTLSASAFSIPPPSGPYAVSMSVDGLTDDSRQDPYAPADAPHARRVIISTFLPVNETVTPCASRDAVPYMTPKLAQVYDENAAAVIGMPNGTFASIRMESCKPKKLPSRCKPAAAAAPLVIFSPGWGNPRLMYGAMASEIASHGFAVVTIDHPYDASVIEDPNGAVYLGVDLDGDNSTVMDELVQVRAQDASFVLTHLHENPVPGINVEKTIMAGHSLGGATSAAAMLLDRRILGGMNLDGMLFDPVAHAGLEKPFVLVGASSRDKSEPEGDPTWVSFYDASTGPKAQLVVDGTTHGSFTDLPELIKATNRTLPAEVKAALEAELGTMEFGRAPEVVAGLVQALAGLVFDGEKGSVFGAGDAEYPEVSVKKASL